MLASLACAPRRLTCRYWAGRVALRENRAPTHGLTAPRLSEASRPKSSLYEIRSRRVRDSTLVAWYSCLYAPRTGGAYDSHHRTAGIPGRTRRRGGGVAARGASAAVGFLPTTLRRARRGSRTWWLAARIH